MLHEVRSILFDLQHAAGGIELFVEGKSFAEFANDLMLRRAVERQFEIIGEAMTRLRKADPVLIEKITDYRGIIRFRNVLIHGYDVINDEITWRILIDKLPVLKRELDELSKLL
jgi:uncharacterized protein with HEPN domain